MRTAQHHANGTRTVFGYDGRGLIGSIWHKKSNGHTLSYRDYWRDDRDRITAWRKSAAKFAVGDEEDWRPAPAPESSSLTKLRNAAKACTACHLYKHATQTVFGEGPKGATLMLLGEQPGDQEDLAGKPFVGPAEKFWIARWKKRGSIEGRSMSQTR